MTTTIVLIAISFGLWALVHSLMAGDRVKTWFQRRLGRFAPWYRLLYNAVALLTLTPVLVVAHNRSDLLLYSVPAPARLLMMTVQGGALIGMILTVSQTGALTFMGLGPLIGRRQGNAESLNVRGLYRYVRHPLYLLGLVLLWLTPVMTVTRLVLFMGMSLYFYVGSIHEEILLEREFGSTYREYARQVPRIVPLPWRRYRPST